MDVDAARRLGRERYVSLATFRRNGRAVPTPVWVAERGGRLYVFSEGAAGKVKRLRNDARVRVAPCNARGALRGEWNDGRGRIVRDPATVDAAYAAFAEKYGWQIRLANALSRLSGRFERRAMLEIELGAESPG